ncbi:odorant receptor 131-2-like [Engystomops pustulosus]|uniref:odorant receptor 131-2-like n=1 Tax=Engystomops pustulosus TaxID=76066 RepID=UPI003AFB1CD4
MENVSVVDVNLTIASISNANVTSAIKTFILVLFIVCFFFFLCFIKILLSIFFTITNVQDNARYVLFAHMLFCDSFYLFLGLLLLALSIYMVYLPLNICYIILTATLTSFVVTPYNLAILSLERYVAICHPLRHTELCTVPKSCAAIALMWIFGLLPNIVDMIIMSFSIEKSTFLSTSVACKNAAVIMTPLQNTMKSVNIITGLCIVGLIIVFTYIKVIAVAHKIGGSSAFKAGKTVMLHAFQLLLCMTSLTSHFVETTFRNYHFSVNVAFFFITICLPRFLSPLIYGIRDELFRKYIKKMYSNLKI